VRTALLRAFVLVFGVAALWTSRDALNPDGVAYLDASDVYLGGSLASGTGHWSPLYPLMLAGARALLSQLPEREVAIAQGVNLAAFLFAFLALEYFIREVRRATSARRPGAPSSSDAVWLVLVYVTFAVATTYWIRMWLLSPDMCVLAIVLAAAGVCVRITSGRTGWLSPAALGVLLGLGYLAKTAMFPVAIVVLGTLMLTRRREGGMREGILAGALFLAIALPQIAYVTRLKGAPTFGDVGRLDYLWFTAGVPGPLSSELALPARLPSPTGTRQTVVPLDPARDAHPAVFAIDAPIPGTLPIWYDAGYWYRGVTTPLRPRAILRTVVRHVRIYFEVFGILLVGGGAAAAASRISRDDVRRLRPVALLVIPSLAAIGMYALVLVFPRYVAAFVLLLMAGLVPPWDTEDLSRRLRVGFAVGSAALLPLAVHEVRVDRSYWRGAERNRQMVKAALEARGINPGSRIGFIGESYEAYWARAARLRIVSLVPSAEAGAFWSLDTNARAAVLERMKRQGAAAVIAEAPAAGVSTDGWERLPAAGPPRPALIFYSGSQ